jgi:predicted deacylase
MLSGDVARIDVNRPNPPRLVQAPNLIDYIPAPATGIWEPVVAPGTDVRAGDLIGRLHDFNNHASDPHEIRAHKSGIVIALFFAARCEKGLTLYVIGEDVK